MNALLSITLTCLLPDVASLPMRRSLGPSLSLSAYWKQFRDSDGLGMRLQTLQWSQVLASFPVSRAPECKYVAGIPPLHNFNVRVPEPGNEAAEVHWMCMFICMCGYGFSKVTWVQSTCTCFPSSTCTYRASPLNPVHCGMKCYFTYNQCTGKKSIIMNNLVMAWLLLRLHTTSVQGREALAWIT